jgi:UDPglucose 6-dehydrogenase
MKDLVIGIIGGGVVGQATARCYLEHVKEVRVWDKEPTRRTHAMVDLLNADLIFVCVPETQLEDVMLDFKSCCAFGSPCDFNIVIKSTCPIGTTRRLAKQYKLANLVHSPEFLTTRCAMIDAQMPARNIIGNPALQRFAESPTGITSSETYNCCVTVYHELLTARFPGVLTHYMTSDESEAVKLMTNAFFATKVTFFNEMNLLCAKMGLEWETVLAGILSDGRIAHAHTKVPGPDGRYGFGGACLAKDVQTLIEHRESDEGPILPPSLLDAVDTMNRIYRERR